MKSLPGKTRTRQHVLADLSINFVERHVLLAGFSVLRVHPDYGYDLMMATYNENGEPESGSVYFQVKATDQLQLLKDGTTISWPVSRRDLKLWLQESYPVVMVVYDGKMDKAYWLSIHEYFAERSTADLFTTGEWINVHVPRSNRVNRQSILRMARDKRLVNERLHRKDKSDV